jgi:hypothetical protein
MRRNLFWVILVLLENEIRVIEFPEQYDAIRVQVIFFSAFLSLIFSKMNIVNPMLMQNILFVSLLVHRLFDVSEVSKGIVVFIYPLL